VNEIEIEIENNEADEKLKGIALCLSHGIETFVTWDDGLLVFMGPCNLTPKSLKGVKAHNGIHRMEKELAISKMHQYLWPYICEDGTIVNLKSSKHIFCSIIVLWFHHAGILVLSSLWFLWDLNFSCHSKFICNILKYIALLSVQNCPSCPVLLLMVKIMAQNIEQCIILITFM